MSTTANNETLERIKNEVAKENGHETWHDYYRVIKYLPIVSLVQDQIAKRFARAVAEEDRIKWFKETEKTLVEAGQAIGAMYTREQVIAAIKDSLKEAAENAKVLHTYRNINGVESNTYILDKSSITDEKNIKLI